MWILPRATVAFSALWVVVEENEYFSLVENKTSGKAIIGTMASLFRRFPPCSRYIIPLMRSCNIGGSRVGTAAREGLAGATVPEPMRYRIVLRDDAHHALALAGTFFFRQSFSDTFPLLHSCSWS
jgi:hypothetical protein